MKRIAEFPGVAARRPSGARRTRSRPTRSGVADDFHRFYHHHKVLGSPEESVPPRVVPRDEDGRRALPRPRRRRGTGQHVTHRSLRSRIARAVSTTIDPTVPDRNLALELVRVTESAAMGAARWIGRGDKNAADGAAVDLMRRMINTVDDAGRRRDRRGREGRGADAVQR